MPLSSFRLARLWLASGLMIVTTFTSAWAQETPVDPNYQDLILPEKPAEGFRPVTLLAHPERDHANCAPAPAAWHPPILFPNPEVCCPTGVVHRDWLREHTTGHWLNYRQRMLEKDYAWRVRNGCQPTCCPPWSCWGHSCDECNGIGCKKRCGWFGGNECEACDGGCGVNPGCQSCGNETSAIEPPSSEGVTLASAEFPESREASEITQGSESREVSATIPSAAEALPVPSEVVLIGHEMQETQSTGIQLIGHEVEETEPTETQLVADEQLFAESGATVETAGFCEVSDGCAPNSGPVYTTTQPYVYSDECWEEYDDGCHCLNCCLKRYCDHCHDRFCQYLREDGLDRNGDGYGDGRRGQGGRGGWRREVPVRGQYWMAYPVNPYHFDKRDGRIYGAQGYGHAVAVPLAPNVEHTFNYGWGVPSSRLSPVSRMPGAPGVAIPAVPGAAGPGVLPPAFPNPLSAGLGR